MGLVLNYLTLRFLEMVSNTELYQEVAKEVGLSEAMVQEIIQAQATFIRKTIEQGSFESVTMVYLGKIKASLKAVQFTNQYRKKT